MWSVPSQKVPPFANATPGLAKGCKVALGSNGAIKGAATATTIQKTTRPAPIIPTQLSLIRVKDFRARMSAAPGVGAGAMVRTMSVISASPSSEPDARVEVGVADVGDGLGSDGDEDGDHGAGLDEEDVAVQ